MKYKNKGNEGAKTKDKSHIYNSQRPQENIQKQDVEMGNMYI